jgi:sugar transferase (PEP-CTERM/EpsH1 system associated)
MRILYVLPYVPSPIRVRPFHFVRELARRHAVTVLATGSGRELEDVARLWEWCRRVEVYRLDPATRLRGCAHAALRGAPLQSGASRSEALVRRLERLLETQRFDVVHVEHLRAAYAATALPACVPVVYDAVDCISLLLGRTLRGSASVRQRVIAAVELWRTRAYEGRVLRRFDRVAVTAPEDAAALRALAPAAQVEVIPNGVDLEHFRPLGAVPEPATLVFSGKMSYHANATAVLWFVRHVLPAVRARHPEVRLRVAGSDPPPAIRALGRDPGITVTGHLPDLRTALAGAAVAVCPVTVKVGIQNKILEAMAMGLPVVTTRQGHTGLLAAAGRDLLVAADPASFAAEVCRLIEDRALCVTLGRAGREYVETHHRWDVAAGRLEALYQAAVAGRTSPPPAAAPGDARSGSGCALMCA